MILIDSHLHLNDEGLFDRRHEIIARAKERGVKAFLCVGYDIDSSKKAIEIAHEEEGVYAAVGLHPENLEGIEDKDLDVIRELAKDSKVVAIGEIGLDYHWYKETEIRESQKKWFIKQIKLANELSLPVSIHARDAAEDTLTILKENPLKMNGVLHCYSGSTEIMKELLKLGFYFGFDGPITYKNSLTPKENVKACDPSRILSETDSPYLPPVPYRGKQNEPAYIDEIVKQMALLRGIDEENMAKLIQGNFERLFHVEPIK